MLPSPFLLLFLYFLLIHHLSPAHAWLSLLSSSSSSSPSFNVSTPDYFLRPTHHYTRSGPLLLLTLTKDCAVDSSLIPLYTPSPNASSSSLHTNDDDINNDNNSTILLVLSQQATTQGDCSSYAVIADTVHAHIPQIQLAHWPSPRTLVILTDVHDEKGVFGGPLGDPRARSFTDPSATERLPQIDTSLMDRSSSIQLLDVIHVSRNTSLVNHGLDPPPIAIISQEMGPWNDLFLNPSWMAISWCASIINLLILLYGLYRLIISLRGGWFILDLRHFLFLLALIATAFTTVFPVLRLFTTARIILEYTAYPIQSLIRTLSLLLWSKVLWGIRYSLSTSLIQAGIISGFIASLWEWAWGLISWLGPQTPSVYIITRVTQIILPIIHFSLGAIFAFYTIQFWRHGKSRILSHRSVKILHQITKIAGAGCFLYLLIAITTLVSSLPSIQDTPAGLYWTEALFILWQTCDNAIIILCLDVNIPFTKPPTPSSVNSTSSNHSSHSTAAYLPITIITEVSELPRRSLGSNDFSPSPISSSQTPNRPRHPTHLLSLLH
ncbi:MAG: hypothetical protein DHS80DRAFT_31031 [Piptocephalis tieghemiana]|nr:MAG: hypothetical protein DHS80DRAFT_31031 [Piptocephalis tieghemiana]